MKRTAVLLLAGVASCALFDHKSGPPAQLSGLPRELTANESHVVDASNQFALTLFKRLNQADSTSNVFVSPMSVSFSLGMAMNGANGTTFDEMRATLGFGADDLAAINAGYKGLFSLESGLDPSTTFSIANSVWARQTLPVTTSFKDAMLQTFQADVKSSPFDATTLSAVNNWVSAKTAGKIPTILDAIDPSDVMFLVNAIYFKGSWREKFDLSRTQSGPFYALGGTQSVPMMHRPKGAGKIRSYANASYSVGELSYGNGAFVMTIVMPAGDINAFAASLDTAAWRTLSSPKFQDDDEVVLPRFTMEYKRELSSDLQALGMNAPFMGGVADFSNMSPMGKQLVIAFVQHKTFVRVDEEGTEAAAVTNTGMRVTSAGGCFCVNKPFIFAIRERFSGTILFMGKIVRIPF